MTLVASISATLTNPYAIIKLIYVTIRFASFAGEVIEGGSRVFVIVQCHALNGSVTVEHYLSLHCDQTALSHIQP